jgi:hypothetical protein
MNYHPFTYLRAITLPFRDRDTCPAIREKQGRQEEVLPPDYEDRFISQCCFLMWM